MTDLKIARGFALPLDLVTEATAIVATRGAGNSSASSVLVEEGFDAHVQTAGEYPERGYVAASSIVYVEGVPA